MFKCDVEKCKLMESPQWSVLFVLVLTEDVFGICQDQGIGIAISEEDTVNGVVVKSLIEHGAAGKVSLLIFEKTMMRNLVEVEWNKSSSLSLLLFQDGRIKIGDQILAVDDEVVVGYPIEKVSNKYITHS